VVTELGDARRRCADEEQARARGGRRDFRHRVEHVAPAAPRAHANLGHEEVLGGEAELSPDRLTVEARVKALQVGAGIDHLDLLGRHARRHEIALDRFADRDDRVHAPAGVPDPPRPRHAKADAAVQDQPRPGAHEPGEQGQGAGASLVGVGHLDVTGADHLRDPPCGAHVPGALHGDGRVADARRAHPLGPYLARRRRDRDRVAARGQADREVAQLDRGTGEVIRFGI
jgi:hypothetical protein